MFYLFSDGYCDQFGGPNDKRFTSSKLKNIFVEISGYNMEKQLKSLEDIFEDWRSDREQVDDVLILGFKL